ICRIFSPVIRYIAPLHFHQGSGNTGIVVEKTLIIGDVRKISPPWLILPLVDYFDNLRPCNLSKSCCGKKLIRFIGIFTFFI
ncbi:MAG: hypothetical protein SVR08_11580, partial [Spirochaetota bacterium]|nr:hypothetical protein [Spirochaetota bacterium]